MFWLAGKGIVSPQTHINVNWRNQDFIPAFTQWNIANKKKKPFTASNSPRAHTSALNPPTIQTNNNKKNVCKSCAEKN